MLKLLRVVLLIGVLREVWCGVPQCFSMLSTCVYQGSSTAFGDGYFKRETSYRPTEEEEEMKRAALCSPANWRGVEQCLSDCPLRLEVTSPASLAMRLCLVDNSFLPFLPAAHLDVNHALHKNRLDIVAVGNAEGTSDRTRHGCKASDWVDEDRSYQGKIVLARRGTCKFIDKIKSGQGAGAAAVLILNSQTQHVDLIDQIKAMSGTSEGLHSTLGMFTQMAGGDQVMQYLDAGGEVQGHLELDCAKTNDKVDEYLEECPNRAAVILSEGPGCGGVDAVCARCPLKLFFDSVENSRGYSAFAEGVDVRPQFENFCVLGNDLLPRRSRSHLMHAEQLPLRGPAVHTTAHGCDVTSYLPHAGRVVFLQRPSSCLAYTSVLLAQEAGVSAVVLLGMPGDKTWNIQGPSELVTIPVHSLSAKDSASFVNVVNNLPGSNVAGSVVTDLSITFFRDDSVAEVLAGGAKEVLFEQSVATPSHRAAWEWSGTVVLSLIFVVILSGVIAGKFVYQRIHALRLPRVNQGRQIPLSAASMVLSVTLLITISCTAFLLAHAAGKSSTETARDAGVSAVNATLHNSIMNTEDLTGKWLLSIVDIVADSAATFFTDAQRITTTLTTLMQFYDGTWTTFYSYWLTIKALEDGQDGAWRIAARSREGFYLDGAFVSDYRDNAVRGDGLPHISTTNNGLLYGHVQILTRRGQYVTNDVVGRAEWNPLQRYGQTEGDTFSLLRNEGQDMVWLYPSTSTPDGMSSKDHPIVLLSPVKVASEKVITLELHRTSNELDHVVKRALQKVGGVGNSTTFCFTQQGTLLSSSQGTTRLGDRFMMTHYKGGHTSLTLHTVDSIELRSMASYFDTVLQQHPGTSITTVAPSASFEATQYYRHVDGAYDIMRFDFDDYARFRGRAHNGMGVVLDKSGEMYTTSLRGAEITSEGELSLDGVSFLMVFAYLTPDVPKVAATQNATPWDSTYLHYRHLMLSPEGIEVISTYDGHQHTWNPVLREWFARSSLTVSAHIFPTEVVPGVTDEASAPRIFSDTEVAGTTFRLFANGKLVVGVTRFGCETESLPDGPPLHEWTHIAASVDWVNKKCKVFINGVLLSERRLSDQAEAISANVEHYRVGERLVGRLDDFHIIATALSEQEAAHLYKEKRFRRVVEKKRWRYVLRSFDIPGYTPLEITSGLLVPENDILRKIVENNRITQANLHIRDNNTQKELDLKVNEAILVVTCVALLSVLVFMVFNDLLTQPFARFACLLTDAAVMKVDEHDIGSTTFFISELNALHSAMSLMMRNLKEYRSYMPRTLLEGDDSTDQEPEEGHTTNTGSRAGISASHHSSRTGRTFSHQSDPTSSPAASQDHVIQTFASAKERKKIMAVVSSLSRRKVSFVVLNIKAFHSLFEEKETSGKQTGVETHCSVIEIALSVFQTCKGVPDTFNGDRVLCSFNAVRQMSNCRGAVGRAIIQLEEHAGSINGSVKLSLAGVAGDVRVGNMGTDLMKRYSFISPVVTWVYALERYANYKGVGNLVDTVSDDLKAEYVLQHIDSVLFKKKHVSRAIRVSCLHTIRDQRNVEWMYQLDETDQHDPYAVWNDACRLLFDGVYEVWLCLCGAMGRFFLWDVNQMDVGDAWLGPRCTGHGTNGTLFTRGRFCISSQLFFWRVVPVGALIILRLTV